jgi:hypothetical protein
VIDSEPPTASGREESDLVKKLLIVLLVTLLFLSFSASPALAQDEEPAEEQEEKPFAVYSLGQHTLSVSAALSIPLFLQSIDGDYSRTNLKLGGVGSIQWGIHLSNNWRVGIEVGGMFNKSIQENRLWQLPITVKGSYIIHFFPFEFPIFVGTGMDIVKYTDQVHLNWIIKPGFSSIWKYNINWGFGLNVVYWWVPQWWPTDPDKARMGNFLEISLRAQYNF